MLYEEDDIDFVMTHDWPQNVFHNEDPEIENRLLKIKPFFRDDDKSENLGQLYDKIMDNLRPEIWFSAHLHVKYNTTDRMKMVILLNLSLDKLMPRPD